MISEILFNDRDEWRLWLKNNHSICKEVWLIYYKKATNMKSVKQPEAVEEALCYGWIDSIVKRVDEEKYKQKFTPRNDKSNWSDLNRSRVAKLIKEDKMTKAGMKKINIAKKNGMWTKINRQTNVNNIPIELENELTSNRTSKMYWDQLSPSHKKQYLYWINDAKQDATKIRRIAKTIEMLANNLKPGMI